MIVMFIIYNIRYGIYKDRWKTFSEFRSENKIILLLNMDIMQEI